MPAETLNQMIMGFAIILGILAIYVVTLIIRLRQATRRFRKNREQ
ncbi:MAG: hypothetical protein ACK2TV_08485 [Anaerolineales bacterium]